jgi:hypothetical protein
VTLRAALVLVVASVGVVAASRFTQRAPRSAEPVAPVASSPVATPTVVSRVDVDAAAPAVDGGAAVPSASPLDRRLRRPPTAPPSTTRSSPIAPPNPYASGR